MATISTNTANIQMYDNYATINSQLLHVTISNLLDLETQLWRLYIEVNGVIHNFMLEILTSCLPWRISPTTSHKYCIY